MSDEKRGVERFVEDVMALGYAPERHDAPNEVSFEYVIENGPRYGETVELGFEVPESWPNEPPHGPCYRPAILRDTNVQGVHTDGRHFGTEWDHWSRPHECWAASDHTLQAYMRHLRKLHDELPALEQTNAA